jgi:hypothetical protein
MPTDAATSGAAINAIARLIRQKENVSHLRHVGALSRHQYAWRWKRSVSVALSEPMVASRHRPKGGRAAPFGLGIPTLLALVLLTPSEIGSQELAALFARQPVATMRGPARAAGSPFRIIQPATLTLPRTGMVMPVAMNYVLAGLDSSNADITGTIRERILGESQVELPPARSALVDRSSKGDRLGSSKGDRLQVVPLLEAPPDAPATDELVADDQSAPADPSLTPALAEDPAIQALPLPPAPPDDADEEPVATAAADDDLLAEVPLALIYFGAAPMGLTLESLRPWEEGEAPKIATLPVTVDHDVETAALTLDRPDVAGPVEAVKAGETIVDKGEVTGADRRPMTPAERLRLEGRSRTRTEKCLAEAIYFEARGEAVRGQIAVAQVVVNRAFSGHYPTTICGVVYQNSQRHLACQFTFACDGIPDVIREPDAWERAKKIAAQVLDGRLWLPEVGKATHYHSHTVRPGWVREMTRMHRLGVHTFYRPRKWGDGADAPQWGDAEATAEAARKL